MDEIWANKEVIPILEVIKTTRPSLTIKLGGILSNYKLLGPDPRKIFLKRANFEAMKPKKKKQRKNFGHFVLSLQEATISKLEFRELIKRGKLKLTESLILEIMNAFQAGTEDIDLGTLKGFYLQEYPETTTPPPKPEKKKGKKKEKGDKTNGKDEPEIENKKSKKTVKN